MMQETNPADQQSENAILQDEEVALIAQKIKRFTVVSLMILFTGVFAVLGALLYKSQSKKNTSIGDHFFTLSSVFEKEFVRLDIPKGYQLVATHFTKEDMVVSLVKDHALIMVLVRAENLANEKALEMALEAL